MTLQNALRHDARHLTLGILAAGMLTTLAPAADYVVPVDQPTIQDAINVATDGDRILLQAGTYFEQIDLLGKQLTVRGLPSSPSATVIDASAAGPVVLGLSTGAGPDTIIANLTLQNGSVGGSGGAVRVTFDANPTFRNVRFVSNDAGAVGGAVDIFAAHATFLDCTFKDNDAGGSGGAVSGKATFRNCTFKDNSAGNNGGACQTNDSYYVNCLFHDNSAGGNGGALSLTGDDRVINSTFAQNSAVLAQSIYMDSTSAPFIANCLASGVPAFNSASGAETVTYCNTEGGPYPGFGNVNALPLYVDAAADDFRLQPTSPAIDAGNTWLYAGPMVDIDEGERGVDDPATANTGTAEYGGRIDMGAYEYQVTPTVCDGDVDGDGMVDTNDLLIVIGAWGLCP